MKKNLCPDCSQDWIAHAIVKRQSGDLMWICPEELSQEAS